MTDLPESILSSPAQRQQVPWRPWEAILVWLLAQAFTIPVVIAVTDEDLLLLLGYLVGQTALGIALLVYVRMRYGVGLEALGFRGFDRAKVGHGFAVGLGGVVAGYFAVYVALFVSSLIAGRELTPPKQLDIGDAPPGWLIPALGFVIVVITPIVEEAFFRGFIFQGLRNRRRFPTAAIIASMFFALAHLLPLVMLATFLLGLLLSWTFERQDSIVPAVVAHMTFNGLGFALLTLA